MLGLTPSYIAITDTERLIGDDDKNQVATNPLKDVAGNTLLGGEDFVNRLVNHFCTSIQAQFRKDLKKNARALRRLKNASECEKS
ncbi:13143_t:CDS:2 [Funneliformis mosseae]|uniref:13143_t:CDS:1 n=1 Tax=Funneliformis mosseae TaxID=27381 RepID=A0A9N9DBT8_FUNMO|nr:13143_t:CDS:2 [Funneliformis mosseae]